MLITFTSKAAPEVLMYKDHAKRILDLLQKDSDRGVITAAEAPQAVAVLNAVPRIKGNDWVFASPKVDKKPVDEKAGKKKTK